MSIWWKSSLISERIYRESMIRFCTLYSSSNGNCTFISDTKTNILIDAGVSASKITASLQKIGVNPNDIDAILITHEHSDHTCGLGVFTRKYSVPVYTNSATADAISKGDCIDSKYINIFTTGESFVVGTASVRPFKTPHDAAESVGYTVSFDERKFGFATDTGCITKPMLSALAGCEAVVIEANHNVDMLMSGSYPYPLKKRILSDNGHLSNENCAWLATQLAIWGTKYITLGHLSTNNNTYEMAYESAVKLLRDNNLDTDVFLNVAQKSEITHII